MQEQVKSKFLDFVRPLNATVKKNREHKERVSAYLQKCIADVRHTGVAEEVIVSALIDVLLDGGNFEPNISEPLIEDAMRIRNAGLGGTFADSLVADQCFDEYRAHAAACESGAA